MSAPATLSQHVSKHMSHHMLTQAFQISAGRSTRAEIPKDILSTGVSGANCKQFCASVCDEANNCKTNTVAKSEVIASGNYYYYYYYYYY